MQLVIISLCRMCDWQELRRGSNSFGKIHDALPARKKHKQDWMQTTHSQSEKQLHKSQHLLRGHLRRVRRHGTSDLQMKGVVGPSGTRLKLERRLPQLGMRS